MHLRSRLTHKHTVSLYYMLCRWPMFIVPSICRCSAHDSVSTFRFIVGALFISLFLFGSVDAQPANFLVCDAIFAALKILISYYGWMNKVFDLPVS